MVKFNLIEGGKPTYEEKYSEFIKLYNDPEIPKGDIIKILGWSTRQYTNARKQAIKDKLIEKEHHPKNYHYLTRREVYVVTRNTTKEKLYFTVSSEKEAKEMVKHLRKYGFTRKNATEFHNRWLNGILHSN